MSTYEVISIFVVVCVGVLVLLMALQQHRRSTTSRAKDDGWAGSSISDSSESANPGEPRLGAMHVVLDLLECEPQKLIGWKKWYVEIKQAVVRSGMTIATHSSTGAQCELGHDYPGEGSGYTYCVYVLESHVIVHTTPESNLVNVCVFFCNFREDNSAKAVAVAEELARMFGSKRPVEKRVPRYS